MKITKILPDPSRVFMSLIVTAAGLFVLDYFGDIGVTIFYGVIIGSHSERISKIEINYVKKLEE